MTPDFPLFLIAAVFAAQIAVLSFYAPMSWQRYHALLFKRFPREEYPLLHPLPSEELDRKFAIFRPMHLLIGVGATLTLLCAPIYADSPRGLAGPMTMWLLVQLMLPLYIALPLEFRIRQGLSAMPPPRKRSVELRKWRVTDFVSPLWIGLGIAGPLLGLACTVAVYLYRPDTPGIFLGAIFNGLWLLSGGFALFGDVMVTRPDPNMSQADTFRARQRNYRGVFLGGAALALWQTYTLLHNAGFADLQLDVAYGFVVFSVICQVFALVLVSRQNRDLTTRDYSVYRADGGAQVAR